MDYRIEPTRLTRRANRDVLGVAFATVLVFGLVVSLALAPSSGDATGQLTPPPQPAIACDGLVGSACERVVAAAIAAIDDPTLPDVRAIRVWATLLCGDAFDCPPGRLASSRVAGSAVLELSDARHLWVNVTESDEGAFEAWVIRTR